MHCIQCGAQNTETTRFCNRCGENLEAIRRALVAEPQQTQQPMQPLLGPKHVGMVLILSGVFGLAGICAVLGMITALIVNNPELIHNPLPFFLAMLGIGGICYISGKLLRMVTHGRAPVEEPSSERRSRALDESMPRSLQSAPLIRPVPVSVTEHTTANLDKPRSGGYHPPREIE